MIIHNINSINDCMDLFPMSAVVMIFQNNSGKDIVVYKGNHYSIPKPYIYTKLNSFHVCFEDNRLVYKFYV